MSVLSLIAMACSLEGSDNQAKTGSQTNWLKACEVSSECGPLDCLCGVCSLACLADVQCQELSGSSCVADTDPGAIAMCGGQRPPSSLCLPHCDDQMCGESESCVAGVCVPDREPDVRVTIDATVRHQSLVGFGASLAYLEDEIVAHPQKPSLFDVMFAESGFDIVRLRNRYEAGDENALLPASEVLAAATARLGRIPTVLMTSASPPAALKANASRNCAGNTDTCTLTQLAEGGFNYQGLADYWRDSLEAHAAVGIFPDYVSFQNNPNWVPDESSPAEACRFLPQEGTASVLVGATMMDVTYPGYRQALNSVRTAFSELSPAPKIAALEVTSIELVGEYASSLEGLSYDALAYHLYGIDPASIDPEPFEQLRVMAEQTGRSAFQTEMRADGLGTAILTHYSMANANSMLYLQNDFVASASSTEGDPAALIALTTDGFRTQGPYHALRHYARYTDPGWIRVDARAESNAVLGTAWLSPAEDAMTVVLVNPNPSDIIVALDFPADLRAAFSNEQVERTVFDGVERSTQLGPLAEHDTVSLPGESIVTVALIR